MQANPNPISNKEAFQKLPEDVKDAMTSVDSAAVLQKISEKNNLHIDQAGKLSDETGKLMLGTTPPSSFIHNLQKEVGVDNETAKGMAQEINNEIFKPIRTSLKKIHSIGGSSTTSTPAPDPQENTAPQQEENKAPQNTEAPRPSQDPYREPLDDDDRL